MILIPAARVLTTPRLMPDIVRGHPQMRKLMAELARIHEWDTHPPVMGDHAPTEHIDAARDIIAAYVAGRELRNKHDRATQHRYMMLVHAFSNTITYGFDPKSAVYDDRGRLSVILPSSLPVARAVRLVNRMESVLLAACAKYIDDPDNADEFLWEASAAITADIREELVAARK
jgi:hypothetical protein